MHWFERWLRQENGEDNDDLRVERPSRLTNIVVMGMGEPLANYDALMQALRAIADPETFDLSARSITVSTVGLIPIIDALTRRGFACAAGGFPARRRQSPAKPLVPINKRYPLEALIAACHRYQEKTNRRITFEYALMRGINDSFEQAEQLVDLVATLRCHVNLIPLNPTAGSPYQPSCDEAALRFQNDFAGCEHYDYHAFAPGDRDQCRLRAITAGVAAEEILS